MIRFSLFGIPVLVMPVFWLTVLILGALSVQNRLVDNTPEGLLYIALFMLAAFISVLVHEFGHAVVARSMGATCQIVLEAFGGYAAYVGIQPSRYQRICITGAGPTLQALLGLAVLLLIQRLPEMRPAADYFLITLVIISFFWALFNLLPVLPLDGGRIVESMLGPQRFRLTLQISFVTAVLMAILAITMHSIMIVMLMSMLAWQSWQALRRM
jgi:stage IV sporulation protein FB